MIWWTAFKRNTETDYPIFVHLHISVQSSRKLSKV